MMAHHGLNAEEIMHSMHIDDGLINDAMLQLRLSARH